MKTALLIVDVQRDFCSGGALGVEEGDKVVEPCNRLSAFFHDRGWPVYLTRTWLSANHGSFRKQGGPWPPHCVAGSAGAEFHPGLAVPDGAVIISKAAGPGHEAYSAFDGTELDGLLRAQGVGAVVVAGLATDYGVRNTALDAHRLGYQTLVATDAIRAVNAAPEDGRRAIVHMQIRGVEFADTADMVHALGSK